MNEMAASVVLKNAKIGQQTCEITYAAALAQGWWLSSIFGTTGWLIRKTKERYAQFKSSLIDLEFRDGVDRAKFEKLVEQHNERQFQKYQKILIGCKDGRKKEQDTVGAN